MSLFTDMYVSYQIGNAIGKGAVRTVSSLVSKTEKAYYTISTIGKIRTEIYDSIKIVAPAEVTGKILNSILEENPQNPPEEIYFCSGFVATSPDSVKGEIVYEDDYIMDYQCAAAFMLILQDMYPDVYKMNKYRNVDELLKMLNEGTWNVILTKKKSYVGKSLQPAFSVEDLSTKTLEELPIHTSDPLQKNKAPFAILSAACLLLAILFISRSRNATMISALVGVVIGLFGILRHSKVCTITTIFCAFIAGFALVPTLIKFIFKSLF